MIHLLRRLLPVVALLTLCGCASGRPSPVPPGVILLWPPPPQQARIEWLKEFHGPDELEIGKGFWKRLAEVITGEEFNGIVRPYGVHADGEGRIYLADTGAGCVHFYDKKDGVYRRLTGSAKAPLLSPIGITGDGKGTIYVTDSASGTVFRHTPGGEFLEPFIVGVITRPTGIVYAPRTGEIYVTDTANHKIVVFDREGVRKFEFGLLGDGPGEFNHPTDLALDHSGRLIVTDALNFRVQTLSATGEFITVFGSSGDSSGAFNKPKGVAVDSDGNIYVVDSLQDAVQIFDPSGRLLMAFGSRGSRPGEFWMPSGLFIDGKDTIYVADSYNNRIQMFQYHGRQRQPAALSVASMPSRR